MAAAKAYDAFDDSHAIRAFASASPLPRASACTRSSVAAGT